MLYGRWIACFLLASMVLFCVTDADAAKRKRQSSKAVSTQDGTRSPKYAAIIMNPATGEVYHAQNADETRYPASLTKMMTLYLLFEALEQNKIDLDDRMEVSKYAASMPQTNLSLEEGDRISVEVAIKSLVVRSANDVSVVIAEHLGGSVEKFALMMTAKARMLGMNSTTFKNPNGLPNPAQRTTARDMAKLGIALKRDFPSYYPYFSTLQFSYNGVTYYTHNRVLLRYAGTDGIKTGYIGVSGFNLVTSVDRGGRPLVGVVMGGSSGKWRDNRMIALLDDAYRTLASRGGVKGRVYPGNLPQPKPGSRKAGIDVDESALASADGMLSLDDLSAKPEDTGSSGEEEMVDNSVTTKPEDLGESPFAVAERSALETRVTREGATKPPSKAPYVASRRVDLAPDSSVPQPTGKSASKTIVLKATDKKSKRDAANPPAAMGERVWGIQVGAFSSQDLATQAVKNALQLAAKPLAEARLNAITPQGAPTPVYRARLENLTQIEAKKACELLISNNSPCFIYSAAP